jgi:toluene monooxygenase system protein E
MKTWWHLRGERRLPDEYEVCTSRLRFDGGRGFAVAHPVADWHARHGVAPPLDAVDWERFADPERTTYAAWCARRREREAFVDGLFASIEGGDYDRRLAPAWIATLDRVFAPLRYPVHGLQMIAGYVGSLAPGGRVVVAAGFQAADEVRRVHRLAYRLRMIQHTHPDVGRDARGTWERDPIWQPLREVVERLLCTWDWVEAFAALNLTLKPAFDALMNVHLGRLARRNGDDALERLLYSLDLDARWHRAWSGALVEAAVAQAPAAAEVFGAAVERWTPPVRAAIAAFAPVFGADLPDALGGAT